MEDENTFHEYQYAAYHKPTKKWVSFENDELELEVAVINLVAFKDCTISRTRDYIEFMLLRSYFKNTVNYGTKNFLEFELVKIKTTYTIEEHEHTN
jgi:hypothetical protein